MNNLLVITIAACLISTAALAQGTTPPSVPTENDVLLTERGKGNFQTAPSHYVEKFSSETFCSGQNAKIEIVKTWSAEKEIEVYLNVTSGSKRFIGKPKSEFLNVIKKSIAVEFSSKCNNNNPVFQAASIFMDGTRKLNRVELGTIELNFDTSEFKVNS